MRSKRIPTRIVGGKSRRGTNSEDNQLLTYRSLAVVELGVGEDDGAVLGVAVAILELQFRVRHIADLRMQYVI